MRKPAAPAHVGDAMVMMCKRIRLPGGSQDMNSLAAGVKGRRGIPVGEIEEEERGLVGQLPLIVNSHGLVHDAGLSRGCLLVGGGRRQLALPSVPCL